MRALRLFFYRLSFVFWKNWKFQKLLSKFTDLYSHLLPNKRANPNKRAGWDNFFVYYMKKCCRVGLFFRFLHEKVLQGRIIFSKLLSEHARLLGRWVSWSIWKFPWKGICMGLNTFKVHTCILSWTFSKYVELFQSTLCLVLHCSLVKVKYTFTSFINMTFLNREPPLMYVLFVDKEGEKTWVSF